MLLRETEPFVRQALLVSLNAAKDDVFRTVQTADCRLFCVTEGQGSITVNGQLFRLRPGCAVLFQSGAKYVWALCGTDTMKLIAVNFDYTQHFSHIKKTFHPVGAEQFSADSALEQIYFSDASVLNKPVLLENAAALEDRLRLLTTEYFLGSDYCTELLSSTMKSVLISIVRSADENVFSRGSKEQLLIREIVQYMQDHYSQAITNESVAARFHFNSSYINRVFKRHTGTSMHAFLVSYRLNTAMEILRSKNTPVSELGCMVGFSDLPHFTKTFKKYTGLTPTEYRHSDK